MKIALTLLFSLFALSTFAQDPDEYWAQWNKGYPETNIHSVLKFEKLYADSVEKDQEIAQYYARLDKYRFTAEYTGEIRSLNKDVLRSMKDVFALFVDKSVQVENICKSEMLFKVGNKVIWMPIQEKILKALREEAIAKDKLVLYCLFLNQHTSKKELYNTFFISEFIRY
jgi:hypothetical protein